MSERDSADSNSLDRTLVVVVPAYNEGTTIRKTIEGLRTATEPLAELGFALRVYVVDDGSRDETRSEAEGAGADRVVRHRVNRGLGAAVRSGLGAARDDGADIAVKFDADMQHDPLDIPRVIAPILADEADVVYGNRFPRIQYKMPFVRRCGNIVFTGLVRWLTGWDLRDGQPGIFAVDRAYLAVFHLPGDYNYTQQVLLDAYHNAMRFDHVEVTFRERAAGTSFVNFRYPFKVLLQILMILVRVRPMRIFGGIGLVFMAVAAVIGGYEMIEWWRGLAPKPIVHPNLVLGLGVFGLQTFFFGILADLVVRHR